MPRKRTYNNNNNNNAIPLLPFLLLLLFISSPATASNCTFPSGEVADEYEPCNPDQAQTSCCLRGEACLSSGLCYGALGLVYRGGCIGGWYSAACPRYCVDSTQGHANFFTCGSDTSWWCGNGKVCTQEGGTLLSNLRPGNVIRIAGQGSSGSGSGAGSVVSTMTMTVTSTAVLSTGSSGSTTTTTTTTTTAAINNSPAECIATSTTAMGNTKAGTSNDTKTKIGVAVAASVLGACSLGLFGLLFAERRKRKEMEMKLSRQQQQQQHCGLNQQQHSGQYGSVTSDGWCFPRELETKGGVRVHELWENRNQI